MTTISHKQFSQPMLSRVADSLYWMSRYMERAENISRILDVNLQYMLDLPRRDQTNPKTLWGPVLNSTGDERDFRKYYDETNSNTVIEFLTLHKENTNSILNCVTSARENARHVREQISDEMWEEINRFYLSLRGITMGRIRRMGAHEFSNRVREANHLFQGITDATMPHNQGWEFIQTGKYIERADKTTRIVDANLDVFAPCYEEQQQNRAVDTLKLAAILRSCSAHTAYRRVYVADLEPEKVVEFLVLGQSFPRSIRFCAEALHAALRRINGSTGDRFTNVSEKLAGQLDAELHFSSQEDVLAPGLHLSMDAIQTKLNQIDEAIYATYIFYEPEAEAALPNTGDEESPIMQRFKNIRPRPPKKPVSTKAKTGSKIRKAKQVQSRSRTTAK